MKSQILMAGAAALALSLAAASAAPAATTSSKGGAYAEPSQPIAYSKLDTYLKSSAKKRRSGAWGLGQSMASNTATNPMSAGQTSPTQTETGQTPGQTGAEQSYMPKGPTTQTPAAGAPPENMPNTPAPATNGQATENSSAQSPQVGPTAQSPGMTSSAGTTGSTGAASPGPQH